MENNTNPFLNPDWLNLQQQYIDALSSLNPQVKPGQYHSGQQGWNEALDHWLKAIEKFIPGEGRPLFENVLRQTRLYYSIADDFAILLRDMSAADRSTDDWRAIMSSHLGKMKAQFDTWDPGSKTWSPGSPLFQSGPLAGWEKAIRAMSVFPEGMFDSVILDDVEKKIQEYFTAIPAIGPTREFQEKIAGAIRLWNDYQKKYRDYQAVLSQLGKLALGRLEQKIIEMADANKKISSLRQIYNLWIDSNEEVFAQFAFNQDHSKLYGDLVNSLMQYRQQCNEIMDGILSVMNMPTGEGMNTVYRRQHQMMHALRGSIEMQRQMENSFRILQSELERMSSMGETKPSAVSAAGKTTGHKKKKPARKPV